MAVCGDAWDHFTTPAVGKIIIPDQRRDLVVDGLVLLLGDHGVEKAPNFRKDPVSAPETKREAVL